MKLYPHIAAPVTVAVFRIIAVAIAFFFGVPLGIQLMPIIKGVAIMFLGLALIEPIKFIVNEFVALAWAVGLLQFAEKKEELRAPSSEPLKEKFAEVIVVGICLLAVVLL